MGLLLFIFGIMFLLVFSYARVSLAISMLLYGTILINKPFEQHLVLSFFFGTILIALSVIFHKSAILGLSAVMVALFVNVTNKNSWFYLLFAIAILYLGLQYVLTDFMSNTLESDNKLIQDSIAAGQSYMSKDSGGIKAIGTNIEYGLERITYYLIAFACYKLQNEYILPKHIEIIVKIDFYIVGIASIFALDFGFNTGLLFGRMLRFSLIPSTIVLAYMLQYKLYPRLSRSICYVAFAHTVVALFYTFYARIVN